MSLTSIETDRDEIEHEETERDETERCGMYPRRVDPDNLILTI